MEWQPISTAPRDGTWVDLWIFAGRTRQRRVPDCLFSNNRWVNDAGDVIGVQYWPGAVITHWMPRPTPPEDASDD